MAKNSHQMRVFLNKKKPEMISVELWNTGNLIDQESLTISRDLDILLIRAIDNIVVRNRIGRLSLNKLGIEGKIEGQALWGMVLKTVKEGIGV